MLPLHYLREERDHWHLLIGMLDPTTAQAVSQDATSKLESKKGSNRALYIISTQVHQQLPIRDRPPSAVRHATRGVTDVLTGNLELIGACSEQLRSHGDLCQDGILNYKNCGYLRLHAIICILLALLSMASSSTP